MRAVCDGCWKYVKWDFVGEYTDEHGVEWEVYCCPECGLLRWYAVG